jgi:hypothetical protein
VEQVWGDEGRCPEPDARLTPIDLRPAPFPDLLGRATALDVIAHVLEPKVPVALVGEGGIGKTSLLRHLAHNPPALALPDGVLYLAAQDLPAGDLLQALFDVFYESPASCLPTDAQMREALREKAALILLDGVSLAHDDIRRLLATLPRSAFVFAAREPCLWGEGREIPLRGLAVEEALTLIERELDRTLTPEEVPAARELCELLEGHPLRIIQAVAYIREEKDVASESTFDALVKVLAHPPSPARALTVQVLQRLGTPEQRLLTALAALRGVPLAAVHLLALTGIPDTKALLEGLVRCGLVEVIGDRYRVAGNLAEDLTELWNLTPEGTDLLIYFAEWAEDMSSSDVRVRANASGRRDDLTAPILGALQWGVDAERWTEVLRLAYAVEGSLALNKRWGAWREVLEAMLRAARALGERAAESWACHQLGTRAGCLHDMVEAQTMLSQAYYLRRTLEDKAGAALTRQNIEVLLGWPLPQEVEATYASASPSPDVQDVNFGRVISSYLDYMSPAVAEVPFVLKGGVTLLILALIWLVGWRIWSSAVPVNMPFGRSRPSSVKAPSTVVITPSPAVTRAALMPTPTLSAAGVPTSTQVPAAVLPSTITVTATATVLPTRTATPSPLPSATPLPPTPTLTRTPTPSLTPTRTPVVSPLSTPTLGADAPTPTPQRESSVPTRTPTPGITVTVTPTPVLTPTATVTASDFTTDTLAPDVPSPVGIGELDNDPAPLPDCDKVHLSWKVSSDEGGSGVEGYFVELVYYEDSEGVWERVEPASLLEKASVEVAKWLTGGRHRWRVWARDRAGNESAPSDWLYFTCPSGGLPAPEVIRPGQPELSDAPWESCPLIFEWSELDVPDEVSYAVEVYKDVDGGDWAQRDSWEGQDVMWEVSQGGVCENPGNYRWRVRALDAQDTPGEWSKWLYYTIPTDS